MPVTTPSIDIPSSSSCVSVSIIDTTFRVKGLPTQFFMGPELKGFESFNGTGFAFLIEHVDDVTGKRERYLFDLGPPKDWEHDLPKMVVNNISNWGAEITIKKYVSDILEDNGIGLDTIDAVIWSHAHWDHIGRPSLFPSSTDLITGPCVKEALSPGYPENKTSTVLAREFQNRIVREIDFTDSSTITIANFKAYDFFGDGSFYLLSAPGHATGHLNALARTTASTFILMGADSFHHASQLRPNRFIHLPSSIDITNFDPYPCPGSLFHRIHPSDTKRAREIPQHYRSYLEKENSDPDGSPFLTISSTPDGHSLAIDLIAARETITGLQAFDADPNVFVIAAHDHSLTGVVDVFPNAANQWKDRGWKEEGRWKFLSDMKEALRAVGVDVQ